MTTQTNSQWLLDEIKQPSKHFTQKAIERQVLLTKPAGSLAKLEQLAIRFAGFQSTEQPIIENIHISIFAADHGVAHEGVSAFPQAVTQGMVRNFSNGGAAICVLARENQAKLEVIDAGVATEESPLPNIISTPVAAGTANLSTTEAMNHQQLNNALQIGYDAAKRALNHQSHLFIGGEMGIANTTSASAIACSLLKLPAQEMAGPGTGLDSKGITHKALIIDKALELHASALQSPLETLRCLGGFEIAALVGAYLHAAQLQIPILVDGFISTIAALVAVRISHDVNSWLIYSHHSAEPAYGLLIQNLQAEPLLDLGLRLGEGSGSAIAIPLLKQAVALHTQMATFAEAGVSTQSDKEG